MRQLDPEFAAKLASGVTNLCRCWLIERHDGVALGFTDHDRELSFDGYVFAPDTGLTAAALEATTGLAVDNSQAIGAISSAGLDEADIAAGKYDRASVRQWYVDWNNVAHRVLMFRGYLGEIRRGAVAFEAELRGLSDDLNKVVGSSYLYDCPRTLGDAKCKFDLGTLGYSHTAPVTAANGRASFSMAPMAGMLDGWFEHGNAHWLSGANTGIISRIKFDHSRAGARELELWSETPRDIGINDMVRIEAGCDKQPDTCRLKFGNLHNFRGFPHMPGEDWVMAYPASGDVHDGKSRNGG